MKTFNEWVEEKKPSIFRSTYYALPTEEQLNEFGDYPDLTSDEIVDGFGYTIIGRGMNSPENKQKIIQSIEMLIEKYPDRKTYKEALEKVRGNIN